MFDPTRLPKRTQDFHAGNATEGTRNREAFKAACQCRDAGATKDEALAYVETGATRCGLPLREVREAVRSAYKRSARKPITKGNGNRNAPLSRSASPAVGDKLAVSATTPADRETPGKRRVVARYDYTDETGALLFQVERTDPKGFRQRRPDGKGGWLYNLDGVRRVLYRLPEVVKAAEVWIVEGEKDADTLKALGFTATTAPLGAGKWRTDYNAHLTGKRVLIAPDTDKPGQEHGEAVARALHGVAASVRVLQLPEGVKDVSDYVAAFADPGDAAERLSVMADSAPEWTPKPEGDAKHSGLQIVNAFDLLQREFPDADDIVSGIVPAKSKAIISGPAKLGKSRFLTGLLLGIATGRDIMGFKIPKARRVLCLQSEVCERSLQKRLKKILAAFPCDENFVRENLLFCNAPLKLTRPDHAAAIAEAVRQCGAEVLAVDPLYRYHGGDENSVRDLGLVFDPLDNLIVESGVMVILNHHHGKTRSEGVATTAHLNRGSSTIADWPDSLLTLQWQDRDAEIVRLDFTLRNDAEPPAMAFERNPDTLLFEPLPDYVFDGRQRAVKITPQGVAATIGAGRQVAYGRLVEALIEKFDASERTAKNAIRRAAEAGTIHKDDETGLYEKV